MKLKEKHRILLIILLSILIELVLSNMTYLNLMCCNGKNNIANATAKVGENGNIVLNIKTNSIQIQNIKIYYKNPKSQKEILSYTPKIVVYGLQEQERVLTPKYTIGNSNTKINLNSENKCLNLNLEIGGLENISEIDKIVINDTSIEYSISRNIMIFVILLFIYFLKNSDKEKEFDDNNKFQKIGFYGILSVILIFCLIEISAIIPDVHLYDEEITYFMNYLNAQVEGILNKETFLSLQPNEILLNLENPYDGTLRNTIPSSDYGDYSLYNGKLYSYFGVAPVILLMLPFKLLTGHYITNLIANTIFFTIMIFLFAKLYTRLVKRYVKKVSYFNYILGFLTIFFSALTMYLLSGYAYEVVINCAILFTLLAYLLILSIYDNPKEKVYRKIFFCSICMGFIVLSKPSYIVYYILLFYLLINLKGKLKKEEFFNSIKIFIVPITVIAIFQMWWNYIRFDNIFCFGAQYQLTRFDMKNLTYISPLKIIKGLCQYLFTLPIIDFATFPFVFIKEYDWVNFDFNVIMYDVMFLGIFVVPISWIYLIYHHIKKSLKLSKELSQTILVLMISCFILLIINIRNGVDVVYATDIKLFLYTFAMILYFKILENTKNSFVQKVFWSLCIVSILLTLPLNISLGGGWLYGMNTNFKICLKNIFEFWL